MEANSLHMFCRSILVVFFCSLPILAGCRDESQPAPQKVSASSAKAAVSLTLLVVDDPGIVGTAKLLRGEWAERSGGELVIKQGTAADVQSGELNCDVVIFPSQLMAELVMQEKLRAVRKSVLEDRSYAFDDLLPALRDRVIRFGDDVFALPMGESPLLLAVEAGVEDDEEPSTTWDELGGKADFREQSSRELIARAVSFSDTQTRSELLFDPSDMSPRLTSEPFVRALQQMRTPAEPAEQGRFEIICPTSTSMPDKREWRLAELPTAREYFASLRNRWQRGASSPTTVLGFSGRMAAVTTSTRNATSAFKLLGWLGSGSAGRRISGGSAHTVWFRRSQAGQSHVWLGDAGSRLADDLITAQLSRDEVFLLPRIPGIDRYLEVLDETLAEAGAGQANPAEILETAATKWQVLTEELGVQRQMRSYRLHLGLEKWSN